MKRKTWCDYFGHSWVEKNAANFIKSDGNNYIFSKSRMCRQCRKQEFKYEDWVDEADLLPGDKDAFSFTIQF